MRWKSVNYIIRWKSKVLQRAISEKNSEKTSARRTKHQVRKYSVETLADYSLEEFSPISEVSDTSAEYSPVKGA